MVTNILQGLSLLVSRHSVSHFAHMSFDPQQQFPEMLFPFDG